MTRLVADIGGTNARFGLRGPGGEPIEERTLATADYPGPAEAARAYLDGLPGGSVAPTEGVFAGAGPVEGDLIALTNCPWRFSVEETRRALGLRRLVAINDFVAQALAVPVLAPEERVRLTGRGEPVPGRAIGVIGAGTGLGVAGLLPTPSGWQPLPSEGGHVSFAPGDEVEVAVLGVLRGRFDHVSNERLLTGGGLVNLATALAEIAGEGDLGPLEPRDVTARAADGSCRFCAEAVRRFSAILGSAAGDLALVLLARGGMFLAGGVVPRLGPLFDVALFRERFEAKGRFRDYLAQVPTYIAARTDTGLIGAAALPLPAE
jgi:glucokinase